MIIMKIKIIDFINFKWTATLGNMFKKKRLVAPMNNDAIIVVSIIKMNGNIELKRLLSSMKYKAKSQMAVTSKFTKITLYFFSRVNSPMSKCINLFIIKIHSSYTNKNILKRRFAAMDGLNLIGFNYLIEVRIVS